jgi:hypothetical protein
MFASVLDQITGQLEKRFLLNAFFPTLLFFMLMGLAIVSGGPGLDESIEWWGEQPGVVRVMLTIGGVAVVFVTANVVAGSMLWIIRLFEGYAFPTSLVAGLGRSHKFADWQGKSAEKKRAMRNSFPESPRSRDDVAATRLGNILLSAETYPLARYHVDSMRTWPRLYNLLPEELRGALEGSRSSMELLLVVAFWASLFSCLGSLTLLLLGSSLAWVLAALLGGAAVAGITYAGALAPAKIYGSLIRTAYDLHRHELIEALRLPRPATPGEERLVWSAVLSFLDGDDPEYSWRYVVAAE